ncbi:glycosyltransferase family 2 protein [Acinetobacter higginsii]|uniref:glycosyltransferase family 2 protein n=1 Tax=Acinetobacter higginsii TaxID=70347 RepID=UPI001F4A4EEF|nr:glycosyltransferase family 2 protein [Acinetobacter higginsii]MCH7339007.1 glycosyltransferase [Acinetobacter higginsii]
MIVNTQPLLTVVIPTHQRPQYLPRAVESALQAAPDGDVEVIVVPNGGDETWKESLALLLDDSRIIVSPVEKGHANVARNHGLRLARGKYIRFLDDDDYFFTENAIRQIALIEETEVDICGGSLAVMDANDRILNIMKIPFHEDFVASLLSSQGRTSPQFYVYRRESIQGLFWDESVNIGQDTHWTHMMCRKKDWSWVCIDDVVSSWVQHSPKQISKKYKISEHLELQEKYKWETIQILIQQDRLNVGRRKNAAECMWFLIHAGFYFSPFFWKSVMGKTQNLFPDTYPNISIFEGKYRKLVSPLFLELIMMPKRWLNHFYRQYLIYSGRRTNWE